MTIPFYYDPMIAKLVCHGQDRPSAIDKTIRALKEYEITGVETTIGFCQFALNHQAFRSGQFDTNFVGKYFRPELLMNEDKTDSEFIAAGLAFTIAGSNNNENARGVKKREPGHVSLWKTNREYGRD
jgi:propionyl-CoA carboxylase alpha chain